jgi:hypothetical protein
MAGMTFRVKRSSLFGLFITDEEKKFKNISDITEKETIQATAFFPVG